MEFHAIVMCGSGRRLSPLTTVTGGATGFSRKSVPKALLPVGDKPILAHSLGWCERGGFSDITIICLVDVLAEIKAYVADKYPTDRLQMGDSSTKQTPIPIEVIGVEAQNTETLVPLFKERIKRDFVTISADFVTDVEASELLDYHRNRNHDTILTGIYYKNTIEALDKKVLHPNIVVHSSLRNKSPLLLDWYPREYVARKKYLVLRDAMIIRHANSVISTNILHSSINFCSHKLIDILDSYEGLLTSSGSEDDEEESAPTSASATAQDFTKPIHPVATRGRPWNKVVRDIARRSWQHSKPLDSASIAIVGDPEKTFIRVESLPSYMEANRWLMKIKAKNSARPTAPPVKGAAVIGVDSFVASSTKVSERTSVKKTVVGNNCVIGKRCRLTGSIILDGVTIGDDVILENCFIGKNATIGTKAKLTHSTVEGGYTVEDGVEAKDEKFEGFEDVEEDLENGLESSNDEGSDDDSEFDSGADDYDSESEEEEDDDDEDDDGLFDRS